MTLNDSNISYPVQPTAPVYIVITATIFYVLIFLTGIIGNVLVIVIIRFSRTMKTSVNMYLLNLCVADLLVLVVCMPTALAEIYTKEIWYFGAAMCKLVPFLENSVANASVLTIIAIGVERYRVVSNPLSVIDDIKSKIWKVVVAIWLISLAASVPCFGIAVYRNSTLVDSTPIMVCRNTIDVPWKSLYLIMMTVFFFVLPSCILFGLYGHLCRLLMRTNQLDHPGPAVGRVNYYDRRRIQSQVMNIIGSIVIIFFICHLPLRVTGLYFILEDSNNIKALGLESYLNILFSTRIMFYLNHALNPIVYNFVSTKFRTALKALLCKRSSSSSGYSTKKRQSNSYKFPSMKRLSHMSKNKRTEAIELEKVGQDSSECRQKRSHSSDSQKKQPCLYNCKSASNKKCHQSSSASDMSKSSDGNSNKGAIKIRPDRIKMNDFFNEYCDCKDKTEFTGQDNVSSSTSSSKEYDLKINVNHKAVCIKLNMSKIAEKEVRNANGQNNEV